MLSDDFVVSGIIENGFAMFHMTGFEAGQNFCLHNVQLSFLI